MEDLFLIVEEGENISVSISGGGGDTLRAFRLRKKPACKAKPLVADLEARFFSTLDQRMQSLEELGDTMSSNMKKRALERSGRKDKKKKP